METKACTKCGEYKPTTTEYFVALKRNKSGIAAVCKICHAAYSRQLNKDTNFKRKYRRKYTDEELEYSFVEDDQYKTIDVKCMTCEKEIKILWDTQSTNKKPRKQCLACKQRLEDDMF